MALPQPPLKQFVSLKEIELCNTSNFNPYTRTPPDDWIYPNEMMENPHTWPVHSPISILHWNDIGEEEMFQIPAAPSSPRPLSEYSLVQTPAFPPIPRQVFMQPPPPPRRTQRDLMPPPPPGPIKRIESNKIPVDDDPVAETSARKSSQPGSMPPPPPGPIKRTGSNNNPMEGLGKLGRSRAKSASQSPPKRTISPARMTERQQLQMAKQASLEEAAALRAANGNDMPPTWTQSDEDEDDMPLKSRRRRRKATSPPLSASPPPLSASPPPRPAASRKRKPSASLDEEEVEFKPLRADDSDDGSDYEAAPSKKRRRKETKVSNPTPTRPPNPPGPPPNAVYADGTAPIPAGIQTLVQQIRDIGAIGSHPRRFPQRVKLRAMPSGIRDLDRRYGYLLAKSDLYAWYGDTRLFGRDWWIHLVGSGN